MPSHLYLRGVLPRALTCTLTGVDARTDLSELVDLSAQFPFVEWGFLLYAGRDAGRYMDQGRLERALYAVHGRVRMALHVCGSQSVGEFIAGEGRASSLAAMVDRVQVNLCLKESLLPGLNARIAGSAKPVIIQYNSANAPFWSRLSGGQQGLFDQSGGRGQTPLMWSAPLQQVYGYAGGISQENVIAELGRMEMAAQGSPNWAWIDMEGKLRVDDVFDLPRCRRVLELVRRVA